MSSFFFNETATTEIYPLSLHERSSDLGRCGPPESASSSSSSSSPCCIRARVEHRSEEHTSELQSQSNLLCPLFFLMRRRPPRSTLFPYTNALPISAGVGLPKARRRRRRRRRRAVFARVLSIDRKSTRLNSSHSQISYVLFFF